MRKKAPANIVNFKDAQRVAHRPPAGHCKCEINPVLGDGTPVDLNGVADDSVAMVCPDCKVSVFEEVILNPRSRNGKWDRRTGTRVLRCALCRIIPDL